MLQDASGGWSIGRCKKDFEGWGEKCSLRGLIFILLEERNGEGEVRDEGGVSMR